MAIGRVLSDTGPAGAATPKQDEIESAVAAYYTRRLEQHGATAQGVDWRDAASQELRFAQFERLWHGDAAFSLNDVGCGYGHLLSWLRARGWRGAYTGIDIAAAMVAAARERHHADPQARFLQLDAPSEPADFAVASGIFNVRCDFGPARWSAYMESGIARLRQASLKGFAFNVLSSWSDPEKRRPDLHYADPAQIFDHCARHYARHVAVLQDYGLYEFTVIVRL